jgi:NADPH:quinone reductase-like Zn-dependent oxidoreductase
MTKMTKYQLEHFENKVNRYFQPLIDEQQLLIKQYRTEATNNVVKKLAKKMGADKILAKMKEAEEFMLQAQRDAKTFFEKQSKKEKKQLAIDNVMESGTPDELKQSLNLVVKHIGLTWNVDTSKIKQLAQS